MDFLIVVFFSSLVQSFFGVGLLLIGTPTLLALGYEFFEILAVLLPLSLIVSVIQILNFRYSINKKVKKNTLVYSLPMIVIGMYLSEMKPNITPILVGLILIILGLKNTFYSKHFDEKKILHPLAFSFLGFFHGFTNLGGGVLSGLINTLSNKKNMKLSIIAFIYASFCIVQLSYMFLFKRDFFTSKLKIIFIGIIIVTFVANFFVRYVIPQVKQKKYVLCLNVYIVLIGVYLLVKHSLVNFFNQ